MINLYHIDCMEFMKDKPDKYYDLAIVDPQYGIGVGKPLAEREREREYPLVAESRLVRVGGEKLSSPKYIGVLMIQSPLIKITSWS